jgi:membrane protease YdiL (CAAX protease family)
METKTITLNTLLISSAAVISTELAARAAISTILWPPLVGIGIARLVQLGLMLVIIRQWETNLDSVGIDLSTTSTGLKNGLIWSFCFGAAAALISSLLLLVGVDLFKVFRAALSFDPKDMFLILSVGAVIGPVAEETFFRGIIYGFFRQWGFPTAVTASTAVFVLAHPAGYHFPFTQVVGGLLFAVAYEVEKNLLVPIVIHSLGNLAIFGISLMA